MKEKLAGSQAVALGGGRAVLSLGDTWHCLETLASHSLLVGLLLLEAQGCF